MTLRDLAADLGAAVLVVATAGLGTLNHTALTLEALAAHNLPLRGPGHRQLAGPARMRSEALNRSALARLAPLRAVLPAGAGSLGTDAFIAMSAAGCSTATGWNRWSADGALGRAALRPRHRSHAAADLGRSDRRRHAQPRARRPAARDPGGRRRHRRRRRRPAGCRSPSSCRCPAPSDAALLFGAVQCHAGAADRADRGAARLARRGAPASAGPSAARPAARTACPTSGRRTSRWPVGSKAPLCPALASRAGPAQIEGSFAGLRRWDGTTRVEYPIG